MTTQEFIEAIKGLSVLELNDLVKACEEEFGVSAAAGVVAVGGAVREITGLGLKEAKDVVDGAPKVVKEGVSKEEAEEMKTKLEAEGAKATLK